MEHSVKLNFLTQYKIAAQFLYQKVGYYAQRCYDLSGDSFTPCDTLKPILIIARQHYSEKWQTYPALSLKELKSILKLQKKVFENQRVIQQYVINNEQDGFDVKTVLFSESLTEVIEKNTILIPETELIETKEEERVIFHLDTPVGEVFWAKSNDRIHSVYRRGLLNSSDNFKMSIGYPNDVNVVSFDQVEYLNLLKNSLENIHIVQLLKITSFEFTNFVDIESLHRVYWIQIGIAFVFLLSTNGYFLYKNNSLDNQLLSYGEQVTELLEIKVKQDKASLFIDAINHEIKSVEKVHEHWNIIYEAVQQEMHIQQFRKRDDVYIIRGLADDASKVLAAVNGLPQVSSAVFQGAVRKSRRKDSFIIELRLTSGKALNVILEDT
jgi:hypothetical protein